VLDEVLDCLGKVQESRVDQAQEVWVKSFLKLKFAGKKNVSVSQVSRGVLGGTRLYQRGYGVLSTPTKSFTGL
jgi:hypothetical protein